MDQDYELAKLELGAWKVQAIVTDDGKLTLYVSHRDGSGVVMVDSDLGDEDTTVMQMSTMDLEGMVPKD